MRRLLLAGCLAAVVGTAFAQPAITVRPSNMRRTANPYAPVVQTVPANAQIDVQSCGPGWCYGSWRGLYGFLPAYAVAQGAPPPPVAFSPPPPPLVVTAPVVVAPAPAPFWGGPYVGFGVGYGRW